MTKILILSDIYCGHVHEQSGQEEIIGNTRVINVARKWKYIEI